MTNAKQFQAETHLTTKSARLTLFKLKKDEVAHIYLSVSALIPGDEKKIPPAFDNYKLDTMIGFKDQRVLIFGGKTEALCEPDDIARALGVAYLYPVKATVKTKGDRVVIELTGDKPYLWYIHNRYTLYPPEETSNCGNSFMRKS